MIGLERISKKIMSVLLIMLDKKVVSKADLEEIKAIARGKKVLLSQDEDEVGQVADQVEIAVGWVPHQMIRRFVNLMWFQQWGAGADWLIKHPELVKKDFTLTNMSGLHAIPISEHILAFMMAFARDFPRAIRAQAQGVWSRHEGIEVFELAGKTMVLVGVGAIGRRTAEIANSLGMFVLGIRKQPKLDVPGIETMYSPDRLLEFLPEGDFVVLTMPLTKETRGMFGEAELRAMRTSAYIINIGRGGTIDEDSLVKALKEGWIAGAGLDVFEEEPLPEESPLWTMENVIITAHYSGMTPVYHKRGLAIFKENLRRYIAGERLNNVVDKVRGY